MKETATWFITGASSGFGRALTERLLERGDRVAATLRKTDALDDLKGRHGDRLWVAELDVSDAAGIVRTVDRAFETFGRIDVVVSNAGYGLFGAAEELGDEQIVRQFDVNLMGPIRLIRAALPHLRSQGGGRVLQISSEGGQHAYPGFSAYHASKWGVEGFVEAVAREVAPFGIRFTLVEPGPTRTNFAAGLVNAGPMAEYAGTPSDDIRRAVASGDFGKTGDPEKMAAHILACADQEPVPQRLALGSVAYENLRRAFTERLAALEAQKDVALASDED